MHPVMIAKTHMREKTTVGGREGEGGREREREREGERQRLLVISRWDGEDEEDGERHTGMTSSDVSVDVRHD